MSTNPNTVKSQDELNEGGRKSDVLLSTIEKTNDLYEQNQEYIDTIAELGRDKERFQKQLAIAVKALRGVRVWANTGNGGEQAVKKLCDETLKKIEELKNES